MDESNVSSINAHRIPSIDTGLASFILPARFHGVGADPGQLKHLFLQSNECFDVAALLRAAKHLGLKARCMTTHWDRLALVSLPALARLNGGNFVLFVLHWAP